MEGATDIIYNTLRATGLTWDEGPDIGGPVGPYVQSQRMGMFKQYAEQLVKAGKAYYCFCTEERLNDLHEQQKANGEMSHYDGHCRDLPQEEINAKLAAGVPYVIRQKIPAEGVTGFDDVVYGHIEVNNSELDDQILIKTDGMPTYNFANVVDDHLMGITHVIRGSEYLSSTPKYNLLYQAFGWEVPTYIHCPPVMKDAQHKLSKRNGDASYQDLVAKGYLPAAVLNYLLLLGWAPEGEQEIFSLDEMIKIWDPARISKSPAIFDPLKLRAINAAYIRALPAEEFRKLADPFIDQAVHVQIDRDLLCANLQPRCEVLEDIPPQLDFFDAVLPIDAEMYRNKKQKTTPESAKEALSALLPVLEAQTDYDTQKISASYAASIRNTSGTSVTNKVASLQVQLEQKQANAASLQEKLTEAQEDYQDALETYEAAKEGYEGAGTDNTVNFMTIQNGYLSARSKYQQAKSALTQAEDALSENESAITDLQNQLAAAQAKQKIDKLDTEETYQEAVITGQNAQTTYNAAVEDLKETLQEAEETKEKREEQLQAFEDFVGSDGILYATEDGVITEVSYEAGDRLTTTGALFSYATSDDMRISVDVTQEDIVDLQVGDAVDITFTAYPEDSYTGSILSINTTATSDYSNTVSYTVEISVEGELEQLYGGMTADVIFVTEEKEDVLYVSRKAIVEENGKTYVYRKTALGGRELAEVETGITNGVDIEILSGLEEGDTIYLASKVSSEAEVKSTEETADSGSSSDTAVGSDMELQEFDESLMPEDMQMPSGGAMPQGGPGGSGSDSFGGGMPGGPGGQ